MQPSELLMHVIERDLNSAGFRLSGASEFTEFLVGNYAIHSVHLVSQLLHRSLSLRAPMQLAARVSAQVTWRRTSRAKYGWVIWLN